MRSALLLLLIAALVLPHDAARGATILVPADQPTIQAGINAASFGDSVVVASGTYFENLNMKSGIGLISVTGPLATIIDGQAVASVITCTEVSNFLISGFTIRNGRGSTGDVNRHGGGIALLNCGSSVVVRGNIITNNVAWDGAGMYIAHGTEPIVEYNVFETNESQGQTPNAYGVGGGIMMDGTASLRPTVRGNLFKGNHSDRGGSAIDCFNYATPTIDMNVFLENTCSDTSPPYAAVVVLGGGNGVVTSNTIAQNSGGYGIWCAHGSLISIANTIIASNDVIAAVGCDSNSGVMSLTCSDLFGNSGGDWVGCAATFFSENGNISADPLFCNIEDGDFALDRGSPCAPDNSGECGLIGALPVSCGLDFTETTAVLPPSVGSSTGAAWIDLDGDGDLDLHVLRDQSEADQTYRNDGAAGFVAGIAPSLADPGKGEGMDWGDYDNDGDLDVYVVNASTANKLYRNEGSGVFVDVTTSPLDHGFFDQGASWVDYDRDGLLDLYLTTHFEPNHLYRNLGGGAFAETTPAALAVILKCGASAWGDYDGDGDSDVYISVQNGQNVLARNDGNGAFTNVTAAPLNDSGIGQGVAWGDYDNDGDLDLYLCNFGQPNRLFRNDFGSFVDVATGPLADSGQSQSGTWADYDNDRDLDLVLTNFGQPSGILRNEGGDSFTSQDLSSDSSQSIGAAWGDYDVDGDLDLFIANFGSADRLFRNDIDNGNNWLEVTLEGTASNRSAIGARITAVDLGSGVTQTREHGSNHGFWSCNQPAEHFGLGTTERLTFLVIRWPSGAVEYFPDLPANQRLHIIEDGGIVGVPVVGSAFALTTRPNPFRETTEIFWSQSERGRAELSIFDVGGRLVRSFAQDVTGSIRWDGRDDAGRSAPNGIYFYRITSGSDSATGKLVRMR